MSCEESDESKSELSVQSDNSDKNFIAGYVTENSESNETWAIMIRILTPKHGWSERHKF